MRLANWQKLPEFEAYRNQLLEDGRAAAHAKMITLAAKAASTIESLMDSSNERVRLAAASEVLHHLSEVKIGPSSLGAIKSKRQLEELSEMCQTVPLSDEWRGTMNTDKTRMSEGGVTAGCGCDPAHPGGSSVEFLDSMAAHALRLTAKAEAAGDFRTALAELQLLMAIDKAKAAKVQESPARLSYNETLRIIAGFYGLDPDKWSGPTTSLDESPTQCHSNDYPKT